MSPVGHRDCRLDISRARVERGAATFAQWGLGSHARAGPVCGILAATTKCPSAVTSILQRRKADPGMGTKGEPSFSRAAKPLKTQKAARPPARRRGLILSIAANATQAGRRAALPTHGTWGQAAKESASPRAWPIRQAGS